MLSWGHGKEVPIMALQIDSQKQRQWLERVRLWQQSGLGVREFCRRQRLPEPSFFAWRRLLQRRGLFEDRPVPKTAATFVQLQVAPEAARSKMSSIDVVLGNGRRLRVRPDFDHDTLRQLLRLLEEDPC
jgi:transposase-like protein